MSIKGSSAVSLSQLSSLATESLGDISTTEGSSECEKGLTENTESASGSELLLSDKQVLGESMALNFSAKNENT